MNIEAAEPEIEGGELLPGAQYIDAFCVTIEDPTLDARQAAGIMLGSQPGWVRGLMSMRNLIAAKFGLKTPAPVTPRTHGVIGIFPVLSETPDRLVAGLDDKHLDFRLAVDVAPTGHGRRVTATTLVRTHNLLGRTYLAAVLPFHRVIVRSMLRRLLKQRPAAASGRRRDFRANLRW